MKKKILVVDDTADSRFILETLLKGTGHEVVTAVDGIDALDKLKKGSFDLILSDILMPRMDGFEFCRACSQDEKLSKIPLIFYTANYIGKKDELFALSLGAKAYLRKPMDSDELVNIVDKTIEENKGIQSTSNGTSKEDVQTFMEEHNKRLVDKLAEKVKVLETEVAERKLADDKFKESELRYRKFFQEAPISLWEEDFSAVKECVDELRDSGVEDFHAYCVANPEKIYEIAAKVKILNVNQMTLDIYKAKDKEELISGIEKTFTEDSYKVFKEEILAFVYGQLSFEGEAVTQTLSGERLDTLIKVVIAPGFEDSWARVLVSITDVTSMKRAEKVNRELALIIENSLNEIYIFDADTLKFMDVNHKAREHLGYSMGELLEMTPIDIKPDFTLAQFKEIIEPLRSENKRQIVFETRHRRKDGSDYFAELYLQPGTFKETPVFVAFVLDISERKLAADKLRQNSKFFQTVIDGVAEPILVVDIEHKVKLLNAAAKEFTAGINLENGELYCYQLLFNLAKPCLEDSSQCPIEIVRKTGKPTTYIEKTSDGEDGRTIEVIISPLFDENKEITSVVMAVRDITDRVKAQDAIREKTAYLESILHSSSELAIAATDKDFRITYYNAVAEKNHGYSAGEVLGKTVMDMHTKENVEAERFEKAVEIVKEKGIYKYEIVQEREDGNHYLDSSITGIYDDKKELIGYLSLALDVTAKKRAEQALITSEEMMRSIAETALDAIVMIDNDAKILFWNHAAVNLFGYTQEEAMGKSLADLVIPRRLIEQLTKGFSQFSLTGEGPLVGKTVEMTARRKDGSEFPVMHSINAVKVDGKWNAVGIIHDITDIKKASKELSSAYEELKSTQAQIIQQEKMASIGQLAAGVAHEINNPMSFISSNLQSLSGYAESLVKFIEDQGEALKGLSERPTALDEERKELDIDYISTDIKDMIKESLDGAGRVNKIVQDLKVFSREDKTDEKNPVNINALIESIINIVWNEIKYKATLERNFGEISTTWCFEQQLGQVIMNLLINAAQAIEKEGTITVSTHEEGGSIYIDIADTGMGIPEEDMGKLFDPFFTTKEVGIGTGLGLSISYDIINRHDGKLTVESEVGVGTTFTIVIPVITGKEE